MKTIFLCCLLLILSICINTQKNPELSGAWNLVQSQKVHDNKVTVIYPGMYSGDQIKVWIDNQFLFVGRFKTDTIINSYGSGTYKLTGNKYEEYIRYHILQNAEGKTVKMTMEMKGDTLYQTYPYDDNWQLNKSNSTVEKYIIIKK